MTELIEKYELFIKSKNASHSESAEAEAALLAVFTREVLSLCADFLTKTSHNHIIYSLIREISENTALAEELADTFAKIPAYVEKEKEQLFADTEFSEIIRGINDTITIKIQSLTESREVLDNFEADIMKKASGDMKIPELSADEAAEMLSLFTQLLAETQSAGGEASLDAALLFDTFAAFKEKRKRRHSALTELLTKGSDAYKRDYLLFEVSSFEEIVNISVSRLETGENKAASAFAAFCRAVYDEITGILTRYGIHRIIPAPGDMFNAREHEILSAEENPAYKKGSVIKPLHAGYKRGGVVLTRANVIAAR